ncbi:MAG: ATP-binding cassette domain-containing protein [Acetobacteraceae bacterium]
MLVLRHGREVETGTTDDVLRQPAQGYTRRLLHAHQGTGGTAAGRPAAIPAEAAALAIQSLSASYRTLPGVLQDISFTIEKGKTLAVVGMSGSGKSTLARVICGLLPQDKGVISFFGTPLPRSLAQRSREQLRRIQLVYQHPDTALNPRQTVRRILGRAVSLHTSDGRVAVRARVDALLDMVGLSPEYADKRPPQLSGGQKQRIGIARALAARPDVILLDEATSALDPLIAEDILTLLQDLQRATGIAYIVITHDIGVVRRLADEVVVLRHGRVVAQGPISDVFAAPLHPYTELLLSAVPQMRPDWLTDVLAARADTLTIHPRRETKADLADASHAPS